MKKLVFVIFFIILATACTLRKEGGTWTVKKTIVDEVKDSVQGTKDLISDMEDANSDLSNNNANVQSNSATTKPADKNAGVNKDLAP